MTPGHVSPSLGCRCTACHAARLALYRKLTGGQRLAIRGLHFAVPRHQTDLLIRDGLRWTTIASLINPLGDRPALVRMIYLRQALATATPIPFLTLTQHGSEIQAAAARLERKAA